MTLLSQEASNDIALPMGLMLPAFFAWLVFLGKTLSQLSAWSAGRKFVARYPDLSFALWALFVSSICAGSLMIVIRLTS